MSYIKTFLQQLFDTFVVPIKDYRFLGWVVLLGLVAHVVDPQGLQVIGVVLYVAFYWLLALSIRKIVFPYRIVDEFGKRNHLKMSDLLRAALEGNLAAAIAFSALVLFMIAVAYSFMLWMR